MKKYLLYCLLLFLMAGCASKKDVLYFQDIKDAQLENLVNLRDSYHIDIDDILRIRITALDAEGLVPYQFDKPGNTISGNANSVGMLKLNGYLVSDEGFINYPGLGKIYVRGLSTDQLAGVIKDKLEKFVKDPVVSVRIVNTKISVLGEVKNPGTFTLDEERITLPQALGLAGDLEIRGERHNIMIIRSTGGDREVKYIDLTKTDWMNSDYYFLRQNDIVYVPQNTAGAKTAGIIGSSGALLSVVSFLLSLSILIFK